MATPIYSDSFISQQGVIGDYHHGAVPPNTLFVVKTVTFYCDYSIGPVHCHFKDFASGATLVHAYGPLQDGPALIPLYYSFWGSLVMLPGTDFGFSITSPNFAAADCSCSGYYFNLP